MAQLNGVGATRSSLCVMKDQADTDSDSSASDPLDLTNEEGWEDVEPDEETQSLVSLFDDRVFPDVRSMVRHCRTQYNFDFVKVQKELGVYVGGLDPAVA